MVTWLRKHRLTLLCLVAIGLTSANVALGFISAGRGRLFQIRLQGCPSAPAVIDRPTWL
jgi:hypothetical protein